MATKRCLINFPIGIKPNTDSADANGFYYDAALADNNLNVRVYKKQKDSSKWDDSKPIAITVGNGSPNFGTNIVWAQDGSWMDSIINSTRAGILGVAQIANKVRGFATDAAGAVGIDVDYQAQQKRDFLLNQNTISGSQGYKTFKRSESHLTLPEISFYFTASLDSDSHISQAITFIEELFPLVEVPEATSPSEGSNAHGDGKYVRQIIERAPQKYSTPTKGFDFDGFVGTFKIIYCGKVYADFLCRGITVDQSVTKVLTNEGEQTNIPYIVRVNVNFIPAYHVTVFDVADFLGDGTTPHAGWAKHTSS